MILYARTAFRMKVGDKKHLQHIPLFRMGVDIHPAPLLPYPDLHVDWFTGLIEVRPDPEHYAEDAILQFQLSYAYIEENDELVRS